MSDQRAANGGVTAGVKKGEDRQPDSRPFFVWSCGHCARANNHSDFWPGVRSGGLWLGGWRGSRSARNEVRTAGGQTDIMGPQTRTPQRIVKAFWCRGGEEDYARRLWHCPPRRPVSSTSWFHFLQFPWSMREVRAGRCPLEPRREIAGCLVKAFLMSLHRNLISSIDAELVILRQVFLILHTLVPLG